LQGAYLSEAQLQGANLSNAQLQGAYLSEAQLQGANLSNAQLQGAYLSEAQFNDATALTAARTQSAVVRAIDLSMLTLSTDQVNSMFGDASVILPNDIRPQSPDWPAHWPKNKLGWDEFEKQWELWQSNPTTYTPP
jgi:uncharacterized protein YjbI with pentapeptide repeats